MTDSATTSKRKRLHKSRSASSLNDGAPQASNGSNNNAAWDTLDLIEHNSWEEFASVAVSPNHMAFWNTALGSLAFMKEGSHLRRWKAHYEQIHFWTFHIPTGNTQFTAAISAAASLSKATGTKAHVGYSRATLGSKPLVPTNIAFAKIVGAVVISANMIVLYLEESDPVSNEKFAAIVKHEIDKRKIIFHSQVEIHGLYDLTRCFLRCLRQPPANSSNELGKRSQLFLGATTQFYHKTLSDSYRLFYMVASDLTGKRAKKLDQKDNDLWNQGIMRLAKPNDIDVIQELYIKSQNGGDEDEETSQEEPDDGGNSSVEVKRLADLIKKDKIYIWEVNTDPNSKVGVGQRTSKEAECFAILEYHDRKLAEESCVELVDIHMKDPAHGQAHARVLLRSLAKHYLIPTEKRLAYKFLFVRVDTEVPESSDKFLIQCGFKLDTVVARVTLNSVTGSPQHNLNKEEKRAYVIANHVTVASSTEPPFTAFIIEVTATGESVPKRYREFYSLYKQIKSLFPKQQIPKPPKKKIFGNMDEDFIARRKKKLDIWLNAVAQIPGVKDSGVIDEFLSAEMKRRGVKTLTEEEKLEAILKRANETPVQIIQRANMPPPTLPTELSSQPNLGVTCSLDSYPRASTTPALSRELDEKKPKK